MIRPSAFILASCLCAAIASADSGQEPTQPVVQPATAVKAPVPEPPTAPNPPATKNQAGAPEAKAPAPPELKAAAKPLECKPNVVGAWAVMVALVFFYMIALKAVLTLTTAGGWKLADALSEERSAQSATASGSPLVASSSRFIAFIGSIILVGLFLATTFYVVWGLFACEPLDRLSDLGSYLISGAALFAPYAANKLSEVFRTK